MLTSSSPLKLLLSLRYTELVESVILVRGSFTHKHAPIYPGTVSIIYNTSILVRFERSVRQCHRRRVHMRMLLIPHAHAIHVHRNRNDDLWLVRRVATAAAGGATSASVDDARLHPLPLGSSVLKPDFHLHFRQAQLLRDLRPFRQRQVFLAVELFLELEQLFTRERRPSAPALCFAAVRHAPATRGAVVVVVAARVRSLRGRLDRCRFRRRLRAGQSGIVRVRPTHVVIGQLTAVIRELCNTKTGQIRTGDVSDRTVRL